MSGIMKMAGSNAFGGVFATGASHTVDELITYLQGIGICVQS